METFKWLGEMAALVSVAVPASAGAVDVSPKPLLVAVEAAAGLCDPADVRRAIGDELHIPIVAPSVTAPTAPDTLLVAVDRTNIVVSLRAAPDQWVVRAIPAPSQPSQRLRAIAWLAGNLARDQVTSLMAPPPAPVALPPPAIVVAAPVTEPPPLSREVALVEAAGVSRPPEPALAGWEVTAAGGPAMRGDLGLWNPYQQPLFLGAGWQIDAQRRRTPGGPIFGAALNMGPGDDHLMGVAAFLGTARSRGHWLLEATAGGGLEIGKPMVHDLVITDSSDRGTSSTTTVSRQLRPALYGRATVAAVFGMTPTLGLVARLEMRAATSGLDAWLMGATVGLRYRIP